MGLQKTTYNQINATRADFNRPDFTTLIEQKGRNVTIETALACPCKSKNTNQQSNCKNCGGTGFVFINPRFTRLVLQGMSAKEEFLSNGATMTVTGDLKVTANDNEELTWMDRITVLDSRAIFNEVLFFKTRGTDVFAFSSYNIKEIKYAGYFTGTDQPFQRLTLGTDYTFQGNIIRLVNPAIIAVQGEISVTFRYVHAPQYLMVDMKRESMETFVMEENEKMVHLPISGTARRQHYILGAPNLNGDNILNNSYTQS